MGYQTNETREDAVDAELRNVRQMIDQQRLETSKKWRFGLQLDKTRKAKPEQFASSFCIQPIKNNTSTRQLGKMCLRVDIEAKRALQQVPKAERQQGHIIGGGLTFASPDYCQQNNLSRAIRR
jgi:hypothetical protein